MNFKVSSASLLAMLQNSAKVIGQSQTMPILDHFLFVVKDNSLTVTASDLDTTIISTIELDTVEQEGAMAVPSRLILETLRVLSDQPFSISTNDENTDILLEWITGDIIIPGIDALGYPEISTTLGDDKQSITMSEEQMLNGLSKTHFAAAPTDARAILNCVLMDIAPTSVTFVATDARQLSKVSYPLPEGNNISNMVMIPRKAAIILKTILQKESTPITIEFGDRTIIFHFSEYTFVCRMIEGRYPNYNSVIPTNNNNVAYIDRAKLLFSLKMMEVCCSQGNQLVKLSISDNMLNLEARDVDFSISGKDSIKCLYSGESISMGMLTKGAINMLSAISAPEVTIAFSTIGKAALLAPHLPSEDELSLVMLIMPVNI